MAWHNGGAWDGLPVNDIPIILAELCTVINEKQAVVGVTETEWSYAEVARPATEDFAGAPMTAVGVVYREMRQAIYDMAHSGTVNFISMTAPQWDVSRLDLLAYYETVYDYDMPDPDRYYNYAYANLYIGIRGAIEMFQEVYWPLIAQAGAEGAEEVEYAFDNTTTPTETPLTMWEDFAAYAGAPVYDKAVFVKIDSSVASGTRTCRMERNYDATITMTCPVAPQGVQSEDPICSFSCYGLAKCDGSIFPGDPQPLYINDPSLPVSEMYEKQYSVTDKTLGSESGSNPYGVYGEHDIDIDEFYNIYGISINGEPCPFNTTQRIPAAAGIETEQTQEITIEWTGDTSIPFQYAYGSYEHDLFVFFGGNYCEPSAWPGGDLYSGSIYEEGRISVSIYFRVNKIIIKTTV